MCDIKVRVSAVFLCGNLFNSLDSEGDNGMAGTKAGGQKAAATNKAKHGTDFYAKIISGLEEVARKQGYSIVY